MNTYIRSLLKIAAIIILSIITLAAYPVEAAIPTAGLIGHWNLDAINGSTVPAQVSTYNGTATAGATIVPGKVGGGALKVNGTSGMVSFGNAPFGKNQTAFTVGSWVKFDVANGVDDVYFVSSFRSGQGSWALRRAPNEKYSFLVYTNSGSAVAQTANPIVDANWHHVVGVYDGAFAYIYIDGVSAGPAIARTGAIRDNTYPMCLWAAYGSGNVCAETPGSEGGTIDDVRIYNRALSATEVQDWFNGDGAVQPPSNDQIIGAGFEDPTTIAFMPDGRALIGEKGGKIRVIKNLATLGAPLLDVPANFLGAGETFDASSEKGLLGIAVHPDFATDPAKQFIYVYYTVSKSGGPTPSVNRVVRYKVAGDQVDIASGQTIIVDDIPSIAGNHNAGWLGFGSDKKLYVATGDGGGITNRFNSQKLDSLNGKILRFNDDGSIPGDNPTLAEMQYVNPTYNPAGTVKRDEIWAMGFRNPWRCRFSETNKLFCNDVGQDSQEEIDLVARAGNYGWGFWEGTNCIDGTGMCPAVSNFTAPIYTYGRDKGASITAGEFGSKTNFPGNDQQSYFFADYAVGWIKKIQLNSSETGVIGSEELVKTVATSSADITDLVAGPDGALYFNDIAAGVIRRFTIGASNSAPMAVLSTNPSPAQGAVPITVNFSSAGTIDIDGDPLLYNWNFGDGTSSNLPNPSHMYSTAGMYTVTLTVTENKPNPLVSIKTATVTAGGQPIINGMLPADGTTFIPGSVVNLSASSTDLVDGNLPSSAYNWKIDLYHNNDHPHVHPYIENLIGSTQSFTTQTMSSDPDVMSHLYRVLLTVKNSFNISNERTIFLWPQQQQNTAPTISTIANQTITQGQSTASLAFTVADAETAPADLTVSAVSSNGTLVPISGITLGGNGANRTIVITPDANQSGVATITVTVSDGVANTTRTFTVTVNSSTPPPPPPPPVTSGTIINIFGGEIGSYGSEEASAGTASVSSTIKRSGLYSMRSNPTGTATGQHEYRKMDATGSRVAFNTNDLCVTGYFRPEVLPTNGNEIFMTLAVSGGGNKVEARVGAGGVITLYNSTLGVLGTSTINAPAGTWTKVSLGAGTGTNNEYSLYVNDTLALSGTSNVMNSQNYRLNLGKSLNRNGNSVDFYYDDFVVENVSCASALKPSVRVLRASANGNGAFGNWTAGTNASDYREVDEPTTDGSTTHVVSTANGDVSTFALTDSGSIGINGPILAVKPWIIGSSVSGAPLINLRTKVGSSLVDLADTPLSTSRLLYSTLMEKNLAGNSWTTTDIDQLEVGGRESPGSVSRERMTTVGAMIAVMQ